MRKNVCGRLSECQYEIYPGDMTEGEAVGKIVRKVRGLESVVSDADSFAIHFPKMATPEEKLLIISAVLLIDYRYYEENPADRSKKKSALI